MDDDIFVDVLQFPEERLSWVWQGLIPAGRLTVMTGDVGVGKTIMALQVAAMVTRGKTRPFSIPVPDDLAGKPEGYEPPVPAESEVAATPKCVLVLSTGDFVSDTLLPRMKAAEADLSRLLVLKPSHGSPEDLTEGANEAQTSRFQLSRDLPLMEKNLRRLKEAGREVGLIVIDPIDQYFHSGENKRQKAELVSRLEDMAARWNVAILITTVSTAKSRDRASASLYQALSIAARSVLTIVPQIHEPDKRLLLPVKLNLTGRQPGVMFSIVGGAIQWDDEPTWISPEEHAMQMQLNLRNPLMREEFERAPQLRRVIRWLREQLLPGRASSTWIRALGARFNVAYSTLRRAYKALGCHSMKASTGQWFWYLPGLAHPACKEVIEAPNETPEGISGISREFTPDNFTAWGEGRDPADAIFAGAQQGDPHDEMPLGNRLIGDNVPFPPWV